jgi:aminomethyltransferase
VPDITPLHEFHVKHAKMTEFAGYDMPLWYSSTPEEHMAVRTSSGIFDVSHMGRFEVKGEGSAAFVERLVPTEVGTQPLGKAFYSLLLNDRGGIIDDLIIMRLADDRFVLVVNAANSRTDMEHIRSVSGALEVDDFTKSSVMIALQGPKAQEVLQPFVELDLKSLKRFRCAETTVGGVPGTVSRTGYTGEDGFELILFNSAGEALRFWEKLATASTPCGLGARDSLRLEAGFPLHGQDIDQATNPFQAELSWVISRGKKDFVGAEALAELESSPPDVVRRGIILGKGIPRHGFPVVDDSGDIGEVTSGTFSPVIRKGIALSKVKYADSDYGRKVDVVIRGTPEDGTLAKPPFYDEKQYGWKRQQQ